MRLSGREQVSHKTLSALIAELELYGYVEVERKGRGRGAVSYIYIYIYIYIYPTDSGRAARRRHRRPDGILRRPATSAAHHYLYTV
jgi:hypothetical protein